jgi:protein involved in polysaccharide export with SLBB domain
MLVAGLTTDEVQATVAAELKRRAVEEGARVSVGVRHYASHSVSVTGLVSNPGTRMLRREAVPLYVVMAESQLRQDAGRVVVMRSGTEVVLDLAEPTSLNFLIKPGDLISVFGRPQLFYYIGGKVNYPGQKVFQSGLTLLQAILAAGGAARPGNNVVEISRDNGEGRLSTTKFSLKEIKAGKVLDPQLQPGDRIDIVR